MPELRLLPSAGSVLGRDDHSGLRYRVGMFRRGGLALLIGAGVGLSCATQRAPVERPVSQAAPRLHGSADTAPVASSPGPGEAEEFPPGEPLSPTSCWSPAAPVSVAPDTAPEQIYADGRAHFEAGRLREAAALFEHVALRFPLHEVARYALMLHQDALNQRASTSKAHALPCGAELERSAEQYQLLFCQTRSHHEEQCSLLAAVRCATARRRATHAVEQQHWDEAARQFTALADRRPPCPKGDELLFNAARALEHAGRSNEARALRQRMEREHPQSPLRRSPRAPSP